MKTRERFVVELVVVAVLGVAASVPADPPTVRRGELVDPRDGRSYPTVEIGAMSWFAENLAWDARGSFCYDDDQANCRSHGRLYRWEQALAACPAGSHLASELEWQALERAVGLPAVELVQRSDRGTIEGARLKPGGDTGFDVQYGGWRRYEDGAFEALGENVAYWTSTETDLAHAQHRDLDVGDDMIWRSPVVKHYALSVRCVVDRYDQDEYAGDDTQPVFSPGGNRIAYLSNREGVPPEGDKLDLEIYVLDLATKRERRLTFNDALEADLAWSPDGSTIAFRSDRDGNNDIYAMAADGSQPVNLTRHPASDRSPSYHPDGELMIFSSDRDGDYDLYRMRSDGSGVERLIDHPANDHSPRVSPDGRRIAFVSDRAGNDEIYVLRLEGGTVTRVTEAPLSDRSPIWTDGEALVVTYGDRETGRWDLLLVSLDGARREVLFAGTDSGNAAWRARDGVLAFGAAVRNDGDHGPGRIHLGVPGGAGPQQLTGRLAGVFGGRELPRSEERGERR